jgi:hypothetical protein
LAVANPGRGVGARAQLRTVLTYVGARIVEDACVHVALTRGPSGLELDAAGEDQLSVVLTALPAAVHDAAA